MAKPRPLDGLGCEEPFVLAAARVLEVRAAEVFEHSDGVLQTADIEPLHDMRVATRRLRAAMEIFRTCFPRKRFRAALGEVKALADALGERRDRDVSIAALNGFAADVGEADRAGVDALVETLREEQAGANEDLGPHLSGDRLASLRKVLDELVAVARASVPAGREVAG